MVQKYLVVKFLSIQQKDLSTIFSCIIEAKSYCLITINNQKNSAANPLMNVRQTPAHKMSCSCF